MATPIDLSAYGFRRTGKLHRNLSPARLYQDALRRGEGVLGADGQLIVVTAPHTGRLPNDKFIVREPSTEADVGWGSVNRAFDPEKYDALRRRVVEHLEARDELYVHDAFGGADPQYRIPIRVVTENAWHALFARNMFVRPKTDADVEDHQPRFTILHAPGFEADPARDGTNSPAFIIMNLGDRTAIIGGTKYAGEVKKTIFSLLNYLLPLQGVMSMHCSANMGAERGDVALFFGLSGTGKTTLSADPERRLIGDDEHGWSDRGVFNFEGGCYAKTIKLSPKQEPEIWSASNRFGTVLENVIVDPRTHAIDFDSDKTTENTRSAYPLDFIPNAEPSGMGGHAKNIIMLTADATGVMPPLARLTADQAMYHFLTGYTAKVAGTEKGVKEPKLTFSTCFGAPFMTLRPSVYAKLLGEKIAQHEARCWLVNTGWTGGPYGVGQRMSLVHTRALLRAALDGALEGVPTVEDPIFGVAVPSHCDGVPASVLKPRTTWKDPREYDAKAYDLAARFAKNFEEFAPLVPQAVRDAGPRPQRVG